MAKNKKDGKEIDLGNPDVEISIPSEKDVMTSPKLPKKIAKAAEALVRKMDNTLSDLYTLSYDSSQLIQDIHEFPTTDVGQKDVDRLTEIQDILQGVSRVMYPMISRMSRKYVGKEIEPIDSISRKRKALKDK